MGRLMNKQQTYMEKMLALLLLVFAIGLLLGERLRDHLYGEPIRGHQVVSEKEHIPGSFRLKKGKQWKHYSGLFILLKQKWSLPSSEWQEIVATALASFIAMVHPLVPTHV
jgi:hypothetical protein